MMLPHVGFELAAGAAAASGPAGSAPEADPSSVSLYQYSGTLIGLQWSNGDTAAQTQIGSGPDASTEPTSVTFTAAPGVTTYETGTTGTPGVCVICTHWWVRHIRNGQVGAWVVSSNGVVV